VINVYFGRLNLLRHRRVDLLKYCLLELEVLLLDHSLLQKHWLLIILHSRYLVLLLEKLLHGPGTLRSRLIFFTSHILIPSRKLKSLTVYYHIKIGWKL